MPSASWTLRSPPGDAAVYDRTSGMHEVGDCLIVPVGGGLDEDGLIRLKREILDHLALSRVRGVLINVSAVSILGSYGFSILLETARAVGMMGAMAVFVGFRPGVAATLVEFDTDLSDILTAVTTEDALALIQDRNTAEDEDFPDEEDPADHRDEAEIRENDGTLF